MNKILLILLAVVVVGGGVAAGLILTRGSDTAALPTLSTGNQWVYDFSMEIDVNDTYEGTLTQTVTGQDVIDDTDCYTLNWTFDPAMIGVTNFTVWLGKDTLMEKKMEMSGLYVNYTYRSVTNISYEFDKALWPLEVGKEVAVTYNENTTVYLNDVVIDTYNETISGTMKVEGKEKITVDAGEFDCFKVVMRDDEGNVVSRAWYADQVKGWVKTVSYEGTITTMSMELKAYSV
jgi:hypothetical protein